MIIRKSFPKKEEKNFSWYYALIATDIMREEQGHDRLIDATNVTKLMIGQKVHHKVGLEFLK